MIQKEHGAIDHFWAAMAKLPSVMDVEVHHFGVLSSLAKILLVLPHSNADPERLFSETEQWQQSDLLSVKITK